MKRDNIWVDLVDIAPCINCHPRIALKAYTIRYLKSRNLYNEFYNNLKLYGWGLSNPSLCFEMRDVQSPSDVLQKAFVCYDANDYDKWLRTRYMIGIPWGRLVKKWLQL